MEISLTFLIENILVAAIVVFYLYYEIHYGRVSSFADRLDAVVDSVIALAREHDNIDEQKVIDRLNGHTPDGLIIDRSEDEDDDEPEVRSYG